MSVSYPVDSEGVVWEMMDSGMDSEREDGMLGELLFFRPFFKCARGFLWLVLGEQRV